ncbi:hypothetical protein HY992_03050 [Candidatus Micrarchaeota archaeon]|nr:hypothetical protein [Candidatus Micrarchaeota archaeon]
MADETYADASKEARTLEKKAQKLPVELPEYKMQEKDIVLLSPADITQLEYYDLLNEFHRVYKYKAMKTITEKK